MKFNLPNFEFMRNPTTPNIIETIDLDITTNEDVKNEIVKQNELLRNLLIEINKENTRLSKMNFRLTAFTIVVSILIGTSSIYEIFIKKNYSQEILLEQKEHNRLLLLSKQSQEDMLKALVSHLDQLISNPKDTTLNLEVE
jgi:hypothetical protein